MARIKDVKVQFGEAVRKKRIAAGLSQEALADLAGLDRSYIGGVERGERNISIVAIDRVARALAGC
jgi:transcriptional regulator with XRE-family HTH domain